MLRFGGGTTATLNPKLRTTRGARVGLNALRVTLIFMVAKSCFTTLSVAESA
ncbi:hypothetical protein [Helicobacter labetoulli]|uniref:hypothetical protein n=1 Tax=Helicobacter labetoulli TaxID=2315333 RepID=UPI0039EA5D1B